MPSYHEEILKRTPLRIMALNCSNVIETIKNKIEDKNYIIMLIKSDTEDNYFHEVLIYGFDDGSKQLLTVGNSNRGFCAMRFQYSHIESLIEETKKFLLIDQFHGIDLAVSYQYPATAMRLNPSFRPDNCTFEACKKLSQELEGKLYIVHGPQEFGKYEFSHKRYTGIACLDAFKEVLQTTVDNGKFVDWFSGIVSAAKKICEHRQMLKLSMEYIMEKWENAITDDANRALEQYNSCIFISEKWVNLCLKYEFNHDKEILERIIKKIPEIFQKERDALRLFLKDGIDWESVNKNII